MNEQIMKLAKDIDQFAYEYDTYDDLDSVPDQEEAVGRLYEELLSGDAGDSLVEYFTRIIDEHDELENEAQHLLERVRELLHVTR